MPRPRSNGFWTEEQISSFQSEARALLHRLRWSEEDLAAAISGNGHWADRKLVRLYLGRWPSQPLRQPPGWFAERVHRLLDEETTGRLAPKPPWVPRVSDTGTGRTIPAQKVLTEARQCPECVAEWQEGKRIWEDTWYFFGHPRAKFCSPQHRRAWRKRQRRNRRHAQ